VKEVVKYGVKGRANGVKEIVKYGVKNHVNKRGTCTEFCV